MAEPLRAAPEEWTARQLAQAKALRQLAADLTRASLELFQQARSLRQLAQALRQDAREARKRGRQEQGGNLSGGRPDS